MAIEKDWWKNKLAEDIYATLKLKEQTLLAFRAQSPQLYLRRHLVDWLSMIVEQLKICETAQHLAVYLMDRFMDGLELEQSHIYLAALVCLLIAVKFEDHCEKVPHISRLNCYIPRTAGYISSDQSYTASQFLSMELSVLKYLDWDIVVPTVPHFIPYFLRVAVDEDDLRDGIPIGSKSLVQSYLAKHALYFQEISLQDHQFRDFCPSLVAASCVASARICLCLTPTWPKQLELMTDYYLEELLPCVHMMLGTHQKDEQVQKVHVSLIAQPSLPLMPVAHNHVVSASNVNESYLPYAAPGTTAMMSHTFSKVSPYYSGGAMYQVPMSYPTPPLPTVYPMGPQIITGCRGS